MAAVVWLALMAHAAVAVVMWKRITTLPVLPALNLIMALGVVAYWGQRWYGYITKGITWYVSDQALPLVALLIAVLAVLTLTGRATLTWLHWTVFTIDSVILIAAALYFTFGRINRLM